MAASYKTPPPIPEAARYSGTGLARPAIKWFAGLCAVYGAYLCGAFMALPDSYGVAERLLMVAGQATVAMSLLIPPAAFAASLDHFDLFGEARAGTRARHWAQLVVLALAASLLAAVGPDFAEALAVRVTGVPQDAVPAAPERVLEAGRSLIPVTFGLFAVVSGAAGGLIGRLTRRSSWPDVMAFRWLACLALLASFWVPFLVTANLILQRGASVVWIICLPLVLPSLCTGVMVRWWWRRNGPVPGTAGRGRTARSEEAEAIDQVLSEVIADDGSGGLRAIASAGTKAEEEAALLAASIRRVVAPDAGVSQKRVHGIVTAMLEAPSSRAPRAATTESPRGNRAVVGGFCSSWMVLAAGLVMVSPLGGVPPSVASAVIAGFLGSMAILVLGRRNDRTRMAVAS